MRLLPNGGAATSGGDHPAGEALCATRTMASSFSRISGSISSSGTCSTSSWKFFLAIRLGGRGSRNRRRSRRLTVAPGRSSGVLLPDSLLVPALQTDVPEGEPLHCRSLPGVVRADEHNGVAEVDLDFGEALEVADCQPRRHPMSPSSVQSYEDTRQCAIGRTVPARPARLRSIAGRAGRSDPARARSIRRSGAGDRYGTRSSRR